MVPIVGNCCAIGGGEDTSSKIKYRFALYVHEDNACYMSIMTI